MKRGSQSTSTTALGSRSTTSATDASNVAAPVPFLTQRSST
jgi:hypothetical protein